MFEKIRKFKDRKGFTLVELIVVLVILAILAALLIPALTGYIDKANKEKAIAECRMAVIASGKVVSLIYENANWHVEYTASSSTAAATYSDPVQQAQAIKEDTYVASNA